MIRKRKQRRSFGSRHNFAYARQHTINNGLSTFKRIDPRLIKNAENKIDKVTEKTTVQIIS